MALRLEQQ